MSDFVPLSVHSQYSILESTLSVGQIADIASNQELKSVALTDFGNMYGAVDFYIACQEKNIHSIKLGDIKFLIMTLVNELCL